MTETAAKLHSLLPCDPANTDSSYASIYYTFTLFPKKTDLFYTGFALKTN